MGIPLQNLIGSRFGRLVVVSHAGKNRHGNHLWECKCDCGTSTTQQGGTLKAGVVISCGCSKVSRLKTHGLSKHPMYSTWRLMVSRCHNHLDQAYSRYGGRGIYVCERWRKSLQAFIDDMGPKPLGAELDRINNDGPYSPHNCRWSTPVQQSNNRRSNAYIVYDGKTQTLQQWANELGIDRRTISQRLKNGWPVSKALTKRPKPSAIACS